MKLRELLLDYPNKEDANTLLSGFTTGFQLHYHGPPGPKDCPNFAVGSCTAGNILRKDIERDS